MSIVLDGTTGITTPGLTNSGSQTVSAGTANGVTYLNGSKVLTSGSALTFDGSTTFLLNASAAGSQANFRVQTDTTGAVANGYFNINGTDYFRIYTTSSETGLRNLQNTPIYFSVNNTEQMRLTSTGLGIGTSSPSARLDVRRSDADGLIAEFHQSAGYGIDVGSSESVAYLSSGYLQAFTFKTNSGSGQTERMRLDSAGNLGLGVTPSAWGSGWRTLQIGAGANFIGRTGVVNQLQLVANGYYNGTNYIYQNTGEATQYYQTGGIHVWATAANGTAGNAISFTQAMTLDASGNLGVGTTSLGLFRFKALGTGGNLSGNAYYVGVVGEGAASNKGVGFGYDNSSQTGIIYSETASAASNLAFWTYSGSAWGERARIDSSGNLLVGKTATGDAAGCTLNANGTGYFVRSSGNVLEVNRLTNDGTLVQFYQDSSAEGSISVSGTTVSYNGGHLSRWAQMLTTPELFKGTVMSNLDEMNVYTKDGQPVENEQLNKVKVSDTEGDVNVAGVFVNWSHDEDHNVDEINMAMTGDMIIRIAQGVTVVRGDLLMSAGDGTAKPQGDDIIRSKTVAKVTSNHVTCTYADGSYCVPCVLMAC